MKLLGKIIFVIFAILLFSHSTEYGWFLRWTGEITFYILFIAACLTPLYSYLIIKEPFFEAVLGKRKKVFSRGEKIVGHIVFWLVSLMPLLVIFYSYPLMKDTVDFVSNKNRVLVKEITIKDRSTYSGTWFFHQGLSTTEGERFSLFASPIPLAPKRTYTVRYLPYSRTILDFERVLEGREN